MSQGIINALYKMMQSGLPLSGSLVDQRGLAVNKPSATAVKVGATYWSVDTDPHGDSIEISDGTNWVVI